MSVVAGFLGKIPYSVLVPLAILMALAPFLPEPHLVEKTRMLFNGTLKRPIDIFDFFFHLSPAALLVLKFILERR